MKTTIKLKPTELAMLRQMVNDNARIVFASKRIVLAWMGIELNEMSEETLDKLIDLGLVEEDGKLTQKGQEFFNEPA